MGDRAELHAHQLVEEVRVLRIQLDEKETELETKAAEQAQRKNRLYEIWLELGAVFHVLDNHDDASRGADLLEPAMERLEELWR